MFAHQPEWHLKHFCSGKKNLCCAVSIAVVALAVLSVADVFSRSAASTSGLEICVLSKQFPKWLRCNMEDNVKEIALHRSESYGFGFSIIGGLGSELPPVICDIVEDSPAAHCKQVSGESRRFEAEVASCQYCHCIVFVARVESRQHKHRISACC